MTLENETSSIVVCGHVVRVINNSRYPSVAYEIFDKNNDDHNNIAIVCVVDVKKVEYVLKLA